MRNRQRSDPGCNGREEEQEADVEVLTVSVVDIEMIYLA
jgi:hypothetical protein